MSRPGEGAGRCPLRGQSPEKNIASIAASQTSHLLIHYLAGELVPVGRIETELLSVGALQLLGAGVKVEGAGQGQGHGHLGGGHEAVGGGVGVVAAGEVPTWGKVVKVLIISSFWDICVKITWLQ